MNSASPKPLEKAPAQPTLGIIGLGLLGSALAERALAAGMTVLGFDIDPAQRAQLGHSGGQGLSSPQEIVRNCRQILLVLPDDRVARQVLDSISNSVPFGTLLLDATTGDPESAATLGRSLAERGVTYLDTTVSGSSAQVRRGEAMFLVGGPKEAFDACKGLLDALVPCSVHVGPCGSGAKMKLVTNLVLGLNRAAVAEGLVLATALGLDRAKALEVMKASAAYSRIMDSKGDKMLRGDFEPQARLSQHLKDVRLMLEIAARAGQCLPLSEAHRQLLERSEQLGFGALDNSAILLAIEAQRRQSEQK